MYRVVSLILALAMVFSCAVFAAADDYDCEANGHEFTKMVVVDPTCEEAGYTTFECHVCGKENIELRTSYTDALGHDYIEQTTDPTCTEDGSVVFVCSICGEVDEGTFSLIPALGHTFVEETVSPTCTADGEIYNVCSVCDERVLLETLSATDHTNELVVTSPTCKDEGYIYNVCSTCGEEVLLETLPVLSHTDVSPTDGYCDLCGTQLVISPAKVQKEAEEKENEITIPTDTTPTDIEETETPIKDKLQNFKSLFSAPLMMVAPPTNPAINVITLTDYIQVVSGTSISSEADVKDVKPNWSTITDDGFVVDLSKSYITTNENLSNLADVESITNGVYYHIQGIRFTDTDDDLTIPDSFAGYTYLGTDTDNYFYYSISLGNVVGVGTFSTKNDFLKTISLVDTTTKVYLGSKEKSTVTVSNSNLVTAEVYFTTSTSIDAPACDRISPDYSGNSYTYYEVIKFTGEKYDNIQWKFNSINQTAYVDGTGFTYGGISADGTSLFMYRVLRTFSAAVDGKVPFTDALRIKEFTGYNFVKETSGKITGIKDIETFTVCGGNYYLISDYELKSNIYFSEECTLDFNNNKIKTYIYDLKINSDSKVKFYNGSFSSGDQKTAESYKYNDGKSSGTFSFPSPRRGLINEGILTLENININSQEFSSHIIENSSGKVYLYNTEISGNTMTNDGNHYAINGGTTIISDEKVVVNNNNFKVGNWPKPYNRNVNSTIIISSTNLHPETSVSIYTKDIKNFKLEVDKNAKVSPSNFECDDDNYFLFVELQGDKKELKFIEDCTISFSSPNVYKNEKLSSLIRKDYQLVTPGNYALKAPKMSNGSYWFDESGTYELIFADVDSIFRIPALNGTNVVTNCNVYAFYENSSVRTVPLDLNKITLPAENPTEKWSWKKIGEKRTLSLNGVDFQVNSDAAIILPSDNEPIDIVISGTNKVVGGRFGIYCKETTETSTGENDLVTFKGNGRLESTASWMREFAPTKPIIGYNPNHYNMSDIHVSYKGLNNDVAYAYENWTVEDEKKILTPVTEWQPYYRKNNGEHLDHSYGNQHYIQYTSIYPTGIEYLDAAIGFRSDKELSVDSNSKLELVFTGDLAGAKFNTKNNRLADNSSVVVLGSAISNTNANRQSMTDLYGVNVAQPLDGDQAKARTIRFDGLTTEEHLDKLNGYDFESFRPYTAKTVFLTTTPQEMFNPQINVKDGNIVFKNIPAKFLPITKTDGIDRIYEYRDGDRNDNPSLFGAVAPVVRFSKGANVIKFASDYAANATPNDGWISFAELFDGITSFTNVDANGNRNIMIGPLDDGQYTVEITWATRRYDSDYKYSAPKKGNDCVEKQYKEKWIPWATKTDANYTYTRTNITISVADISSTNLLTDNVFNINGNNSIVFSGGYLSRNNNLQFFSNNDGETWYKFPTRTDIIVSGNAKNLEIRDITTRVHLVLSETSFSGGIGSTVVGVLYPGNGSRVAHTFGSENQELEVHLQSGTNNSINLQQLVLMRNANFDVSRFEDSYHTEEDVLIGYSYYVCDKITRAYPVTCSDIAIAALNLHISGSGSLNIEGNGTGLISGTFDKTYWGSRDNFYYNSNIGKTPYYSQYKSGILSIYELEKISDTDFIFEHGPIVNISTTDDSIVATTVNILDAETTINNKLCAATLNYRMESIFTAFEKNRTSNNSNGVPSTIYGSAWGKIEGSYKDEHLGYSSANFENEGYIYPGNDGKSVLVGENYQIHQYTNALRANYSSYAYPWNVIIKPEETITFSFDKAYFDCQNRTSDSDVYSLNTPTNPTLKSATKEENYNFNGWYYAEMQSGIREYIKVYDSASNCVLDSSDPYYDILTDNGKPKAGIHYIAQYLSNDGQYVITYTMDLSKDRTTNFTPKDGSFSYIRKSANDKTLILNGVIFDTDKGIGLITGNGIDKIIVSGTNDISVEGIYAGSYLEYEVGPNLAINNPALVTRDDQARTIADTDKCRKVVSTYNYLRSRNTVNDKNYDDRFYIWGSVTSDYDKSYYLGRYTGIDSTFGIFINGNRTIVITGTDQDTLNVAVNGSNKNSARGIGGSDISVGTKYIHIQHDFKEDQRDNHGDGSDYNQIGAIRYYIDNPANNGAIAQVNNINVVVEKVTAGYAVGIQNLELNNGNVEIKSIESNATEKFYDVIEKRYSCNDSDWKQEVKNYYNDYHYRSLRKGEVGAIGIYEARLNSGNLTITNISATNSIPKYSYTDGQTGSNGVGESKYQELVYVRTDILKCTKEEHKEEGNNHCYGSTYEHKIYEKQTFKIGADTDSKASAFGYLTNKDAIVYVGDVVAFKATGDKMPTDTTTRVYGIEFDANILKSDIGKVEFKSISINNGHAFGIGGNATIEGNPNNIVFNGGISASESAYAIVGNLTMTGTDCSLDFPSITSTNGPAVGVGGQANIQSGVVTFTSIVGKTEAYGIRGYFVPSYDHTKNPPTTYISGGSVEFKNIYSSSTTGTSVGIGGYSIISGGNTIFDSIVSNNKAIGMGAEARFVSGTIYFPLISATNIAYGVEGDAGSAGGIAKFTLKDVPTIYGVGGNLINKDNVSSLPTGSGLFIEISNANSAIGVGKNTINKGNIYLDINSATSIYGFGTSTDNNFDTSIGTIVLTATSVNGDVVGISGPSTFGKDGKTYITIKTNGKAIAIDGGNSAKASVAGTAKLYIDINGETEEVTAINSTVESAGTIYITATSLVTATGITGFTTITDNTLSAYVESGQAEAHSLYDRLCQLGGNVILFVSASNASAVGVEKDATISGTNGSLTIEANAKNNAYGIKGQANATGNLKIYISATSLGDSGEAIGINGDVSADTIRVSTIAKLTATSIGGSLTIKGSDTNIIRAIAKNATGVGSGVGNGGLVCEGNIEIDVESSSGGSVIGINGNTEIKGNGKSSIIVSSTNESIGINGLVIANSDNLFIIANASNRAVGVDGILSSTNANGGGLYVTATSQNTEAIGINGTATNVSFANIYVEAPKTATDIKGSLKIIGSGNSIIRSIAPAAYGVRGNLDTKGSVDLLISASDISATGIEGNTTITSGTSYVTVISEKGSATGVAGITKIEQGSRLTVDVQGAKEVYGLKSGLAGGSAGSGKLVVSATSSGTGDATAINGDVDTGSVDIYVSANSGTATDIAGNLTLTDNNGSNRLVANGTIARAVTGNAMGLVNVLINISPTNNNVNGNTVAIGGKASFISGTSIINVEGSGNVTGIADKAEIQENAIVYLTAEGASNVYGFKNGLSGSGKFIVTATSSGTGDVTAINGDVETGSVDIYAFANNGTATDIAGNLTLKNKNAINNRLEAKGTVARAVTGSATDLVNANIIIAPTGDNSNGNTVGIGGNASFVSGTSIVDVKCSGNVTGINGDLTFSGNNTELSMFVSGTDEVWGVNGDVNGSGKFVVTANSSAGQATGAKNVTATAVEIDVTAAKTATDVDGNLNLTDANLSNKLKAKGASAYGVTGNAIGLVNIDTLFEDDFEIIALTGDAIGIAGTATFTSGTSKVNVTANNGNATGISSNTDINGENTKLLLDVKSTNGKAIGIDGNVTGTGSIDSSSIHSHNDEAIGINGNLELTKVDIVALSGNEDIESTPHTCNYVSTATCINGSVKITSSCDNAIYSRGKQALGIVGNLESIGYIRIEIVGENCFAVDGNVTATNGLSVTSGEVQGYKIESKNALGISGSLFFSNPNKNNIHNIDVKSSSGTYNSYSVAGNVIANDNITIINSCKGESCAVSGTVYATDGITINATSFGGSAYGVKGDLEVDNSTLSMTVQSNAASETEAIAVIGNATFTDVKASVYVTNNNGTATNFGANLSIGNVTSETDAEEHYFDKITLKASGSHGHNVVGTASIDNQTELYVENNFSDYAIDTLKMYGVGQYGIGAIVSVKTNQNTVAINNLDATNVVQKEISVINSTLTDNSIPYISKTDSSQKVTNTWHGMSATNITAYDTNPVIIMLDPVFDPESGHVKEYKVLETPTAWKDYVFDGWYYVKTSSTNAAEREYIKVFDSNCNLVETDSGFEYFDRLYVTIDGQNYGRNGIEYIARWVNSSGKKIVYSTLDLTNKGSTSNTNEGWYWDSANKVLKLDGFTLDANDLVGIILPDDAKIIIVDDTTSQIKVKDGYYDKKSEKNDVYSGIACAISATNVTIASSQNPKNDKLKYNGKLVLGVGDSKANRTTTATGFSGNVTMQSALVEIDTKATNLATAIIGDIKNDNKYEEDKSLSKLAIDSTKSLSDWLEFNDYVTHTNTSKTNTSSFSLYFIPQITITKQDTVPYYGDPTETNYHVTYTNYLKFASDCDVEWLVYESATDSDTNAVIYTPTNETSTDHPFMPNGNIWTTYNTETQLLTIHTTSYTNAGKYFFRVVAHGGQRAGEYTLDKVKSDICELFVHKTYIGYDLEVLTYNSEAQQPHWATPSNVKNGEELHLYISTTNLTDTNITSASNVAYAEIIISSTNSESETNWWRNNYEFGGIKAEDPYTVYVDRFVTSTTWYIRPFDISTVSFTNVVLKKNTGTDKDKNPWQRTFSPTTKPEELVSYTNSDNKTIVTQEIDDVWVTFTDVVSNGKKYNMYWVPGYVSKLVTMTNNRDYDIEVNTDKKDIVTITNSQSDSSYGTATDDLYTLIIHGKNNYTGTNSATWNINRATRIAPIYAEEGYSYIYRNQMLISQTDKKGSSTDITVTDYNHAVITIINGYEAFVNKDIILTSTNNVTPTNAPKDYDEVKVTQESISGTNYYVFTYTIKERIYSGEVVETNRRNFIRYALTQNYWNSGYTAFTIPDRPSAKHSVSVTGSGKVTAWISGITQTNLREMKVAFDEEYVLFATPSDKNNEFVGWYKNGKFVSSTNTIILLGTDEASDYVAVFKNTKLTKTDIPVPSRYIFTSDTIIGLPTDTNNVYTQTDTYTLSGTLTATNVGVYKIVAKLKPGCIWEDGTTANKTIEWKIEKATQTDIEATENNDTISVSNANDRVIEYRLPGSSIYLTTTDTNIPMEEYGYYYVRYAGDDNHYPSNELVFYKEPVVLPPKVIDVKSTSALLYSDTATNAGCEYRFYPIDKVPVTPTDTNIPTDGNISLSELVPGTTYVVYVVSTTDTGEILSEPTYFKVPSLNAKNGSLSIKVNYDSLDETDVEITIESGNAVIDYLTGTTISGDPYKCTSELPEGNYNIVAHAGNHTETKAVYVKPGETIEIVFTLRELVGKVSTIVKVATPDTPQVSVRGFDGVVTLDDISSALTTDTDIKYIFTVTKVPEAKAEGISDIRQKLGGKSIEYVLDIPVERIVDKKAENYGRNNVNVFEFAFEHTRRDGTSVIRYHSGETGGNAEVLREIRERPETVDAFVDGTFYQDGKYLYVYAKKYSSFAVVYTPYQPPTGGHGGGGGNFWDLVCDRIMTAPENTDVIVQAQKYYQMPEYVLQTLATKKDVNLVIKWNGEDIIIPASEALNQEIIKEYFIFKNPEIIEPEPIVEPIIIPEPIIEPAPVVEPEPVIEPEPVVIEVKEICYVHWIILLITLYMAWVFYKKKTTHNHTIVVSGITFFVLICGHCVFDVIFFVIYDVVALTCLFKAHPEEIDPLKKPAITKTLEQYSYFGFNIKK